MKITVEEIDILVQANIEGALKEFKKLVPEIKSQISNMKKEIEKSDFKTKISALDTSKVGQGIQEAKKKIQTFKKNIEGKSTILKIDDTEAQSKINQVQKEIDSIQEKINSREMKLNITNDTLDKIRGETNSQVIKTMPDAGNKAIQKETYSRLDNNTSYTSLVKESDKLNSEITKYNSLLDTAKSKMAELQQQTSKTATTQNKMSSFFSSFKQKVDQVKPAIANVSSYIKKITPSLGNISNATVRIKNQIKQWGTGIKGGLTQILKYAGALFSLQGIYSILKGSASSWLSSQNAQAQQLSANIEYMKNALGSVFAGVIQHVTNLVYKLMKAVQSLVFAFSGVNIFAKATASSMKGASKSAKDTNKSLTGVHNEISNVSENKNSGSGGSISPSMDLSKVDSQMSPLAQKLYDFFKPLKESWDKYGADLIAQIKITAGQVGYLISSVWGSFEKIITNGTVYTTLELILAIIGNIAESFANAWNYNGNGDAIVQSLANAFNNLLTAINNVARSDEFQQFLNICSDKFRIIAEKIESINWQPMIDALFNIGSSIGILALNILTLLVNVFKWFIEHPIVAEILLGIAIAIGIIGTVINAISGIIAIAIPIITALKTITLATGLTFSGLLTPILLIVDALAILIAAVVLVVSNWEWLKEKAIEIFNFVKECVLNACSNILNIILTVIGSIVEHLGAFLVAIFEIISSTLDSINTIWNFVLENLKKITSSIFNNIGTTITERINNVKANISTALSNISNTWNNVWTNLKTTVSNIWNSIWSTIKGIINKILGGIEGFANGVVRGINTVLKGLDGVVNAVGSVIGVDIHVSPMNEISLPRLKTGGVLYEETQFVGGEYSGARSNPEIVSPVNLIYETQKRAIEDSNMSGQGGDTTYIFKIGNTTIAEVCIDEFKRIKRQTGKDLEVICDG